MSKLMAALFPEGRGHLVACGAADEVSACLAAAMADPRAPELLNAHASAEDGFWPQPGHWMNQFRPYVVERGILHIPVKGVLLADLSVTWGGFATGYVYIRRALERGFADPNVRGIALVENSPGGEVRGCFELAEVVFRGRDVKPIRAFAADHAYSAAYALASAAGRIVISRTGGVGSIGVVTSHTDASGALEKAGLKITFIHAGKHKVDGNTAGPLPDDVRQRMQERIDTLMSVFVETVARNRGLDEAAVRATEALTYTASQALEVGLADEIGSLADAVAAFAADLNTEPDEETMSTITPEAHASAVAAARAEGKAEGQKEGASTALARISAIVGNPKVSGRVSAAVSLAVASPDMGAEAVVAFVEQNVTAAAAAPAAPAGNPAATRFDAVVPDPQVAPDAAAAGGQGERKGGLAAAVAANGGR